MPAVTRKKAKQVPRKPLLAPTFIPPKLKLRAQITPRHIHTPPTSNTSPQEAQSPTSNANSALVTSPTLRLTFPGSETLPSVESNFTLEHTPPPTSHDARLDLSTTFSAQHSDTEQLHTVDHTNASQQENSHTTPPTHNDTEEHAPLPTEETTPHTQQQNSLTANTDTPQLSPDNSNKDIGTLKQDLFTLKTKRVKITHHLTFLRDTLHKELIPDGLKLTHTLQAMDAHMTDITNEWDRVLHNTSKSLQRLLYIHYEDLLELTERKIQALDQHIQTRHSDTHLTQEQQDKITKLDSKLEQTRNKKITQLTQAQNKDAPTQAPHNTPHRHTPQQTRAQNNQNFLSQQQNHPSTQRPMPPKAPRIPSTQRIPSQVHHPPTVSQGPLLQHPLTAPQPLLHHHRQSLPHMRPKRTLLPTPIYHNPPPPMTTLSTHATPLPPPWIPPPTLANKVPLLSIPPLNPTQLRLLQHSLRLPLH